MNDDPLAACAPTVTRLAAALSAACRTMATAESCTGGWIAKLCTDRPGSSAWFERGLVSYSNRAKTDLLGVPSSLIDAHGAVSQEVALAMAAGARQRSGVDYAVAVTGVAGPDGGSEHKPVGTVWFAWAGPGGLDSARHVFPGDRDSVRAATCALALRGLAERVEADAAG